MSTRNTLIRSLHDVGLAGWFGGSLMGAIGLNGAANEVKDRTERAHIASVGWARWAPANAAAIGANLVGGVGLIVANKGRIVSQSGAGSNTAVKAALTGVALASTAYSGILGKKVADAGSFPAEGGVLPSEGTPPKVAAAQQQLRVVQWITPAITGLLIVMGAQQGEQQRPSQIIKGILTRS